MTAMKLPFFVGDTLWRNCANAMNSCDRARPVRIFPTGALGDRAIRWALICTKQFSKSMLGSGEGCLMRDLEIHNAIRHQSSKLNCYKFVWLTPH